MEGGIDHNKNLEAKIEKGLSDYEKQISTYGKTKEQAYEWVTSGWFQDWKDAFDKALSEKESVAQEEIIEEQEPEKARESIVEIPAELTDEQVLEGIRINEQREQERLRRNNKTEDGISPNIEVPKKEVVGAYEKAARERDEKAKAEEAQREQKRAEDKRIQDLRNQLTGSQQEEEILDEDQKTIRNIKGIMAQLVKAAANIGENANEKTQELAARILENPLGKEKILEGYGSTFRGSVEKLLAAVEQQENALKVIQGFEQIDQLFKMLNEDYYFLTHITPPQDAQDIYNSNFSYSLGGGLSGTMTALSKDGVMQQIGKIIAGESPHRGYEGMFIVAIPKNILPSDRRFDAEAFSDYLTDHAFNENGTVNEKYMDGSNIKIPSEFNLGYLNKDIFTYNPTFIKK
ncbi:MAG TPA: hypothetical protein VGE63_03580 [Candidatus Paceibacterota bacterium]